MPDDLRKRFEAVGGAVTAGLVDGLFELTATAPGMPGTSGDPSGAAGAAGAARGDARSDAPVTVAGARGDRP